MMVCQKIEEMRLTVEELEMLKELADELEEQHVEAEKALQEDIGEIILHRRCLGGQCIMALQIRKIWRYTSSRIRSRT